MPSVSSDRVCSPCAAGAFKSSQGNEACAPWKTCPAGEGVFTQGSDITDHVCAACIIGTSYSPGANGEPCELVSAPCAPGHALGLAATGTTDRTCTTCTVGKFKHVSANIACTFCKAGKLRNNQPASSTEGVACSACFSGQYQPVEGQTACIKCNAGKLRTSITASAGEAEACEACATGTYQPTAGQVECLACEAGKLRNGANATCTEAEACEACPTGTYQPLAAQTSCVTCDAGKWRNGNPASSEEAEACTACGAGKYQPSSGSTSCKACAAGKYRNVGAARSAEPLACTSCASGQYQPAPSQTLCTATTLCTAGTHKAGHTTKTDGMCLTCEPGKYRSETSAVNSQCTPCRPGTLGDGSILQTSVTYCAACAPGKFTNQEGQTACVGCAVGTFQTTSGETACETCTTAACPSGMYESHACTFIADRVCSNIPAVSGFQGEVNYVENTESELLSPAATLTFGSTLESATITLVGANANDKLTASPGSGIVASYDGIRMLSMTGTASVAAYEEALQSVRFSTIGEMIDLHTQRNVGAAVTVCHTPAVCSVQKSQTVVISPTNDHPVVSGVASSYVFAQDGAAISVAKGALLVDFDHTRLDSATITIAAPHHAGDLLEATPAAGITATWHAASGSLKLAGSASVAAYQQTIRTATFRSSTSLLSTTPRAISVVVSDGIHSSSSMPQVTVTVCAKIGFFANADTDFVAACPRGKYQHGACASSCIACGVGKYGGDVATHLVVDEGHCQKCSAGKYQDQAAKTDCLSCTAGKFGSGSQIEAAYCKACAIGRFTSTSAQTTCTACAPGYFAGEEGMSTCTLCSACKEGEFFTGCQFGSDNSICAICDVGKYSVCAEEAPANAECHKKLACTACAAGKYGAITRERTSEDHCVACANGRVQNEAAAIACDGCVAGKFAPDIGMTTCAACELGQYQPGVGKSTCIVCGAGKFGQPGRAQTSEDYCAECPHGQYQTSSGVHGGCTSCAAGHFADIEVSKASTSHCVVCPTGHYQDEIEFVQKCKACAPLSYQSVTGALQCDACSKLTCSPGHFVSQTCALAAREADRVCSSSPAVSGVSGVIDYVENTPPKHLLPAAALAFGFTLNSATVSLLGANANDRLAYNGTVAGVSAAFDATTKILKFSGIASDASYQQALQSVVFSTVGEMVDVHSTRTISANVTVCHIPDEAESAALLGSAGVCSAPKKVSIQIIPLNDLSSVVVSEDTVVYTHGSPVRVAPDAKLSDPDHTQLVKATLSIAAPHHEGDALVADLTGITGITSSWTAATKKLVLRGAAPVAVYQQAIRKVTFRSTSTTLSTTSRSISIVLDDGVATSSSEPLVSVPICAAEGFFADVTAQMVVACPNGKFQTASCRSSCSACAAGKFGDNPATVTAADHCQQCDVGQYQTALASTECVECAQGQYGSGTGVQQTKLDYCKVCAAGKSQHLRGAAKCIDCGVGRYAAEEEALTCSACSAGRYQVAVGRTGCTKCDAGTSNKITGQSSASACVSCAAGSYAPSEGLAECLPWTTCEPGSFNEAPSTTMPGHCAACPVGKFQPTTTYVAEPCGDWVNCAAGTFIVGQTAEFSGKCQMCAAGEYREATAHIYSECTRCPAGRFVAGEGSTVEAACVQCVAGKYADEDGAATCKECATDKYGLAGATGCQDCSYGGWHSWGGCDKTCETGIRKRRRKVRTPVAEAKRQCISHDTEACNRVPCPHRVHCKHMHCRYRSDDGDKYQIQVYHHHKDAPAVHHCKLYNVADGSTQCHCHCWSTLPTMLSESVALPWTTQALRGESP